MIQEDLSLYKLQLLGIIEGAHVELSNILPSEWVEQNVVMGEPRPGPYRYNYTPYAREIIDRLHAADPAKWIAVMKGLQIGMSAGVIIPGMGYIIKEAPGNTYFTVGAPDLIDKSMEKLDLMIDNAGLRPYIKPRVSRNRANKSGDTNTKKDFSGGFINITTPNNHKEWRDVSLKYGFIDDFEAAKSASKESGSTRKLMEGRFAAYKDTHKIYYISTPELKEGSNIEPAYLLGDQRKYLVPCPCCGELIELRWNVPEGIGTIWPEALPDGTGIVWQVDDDNKVIPGSVGYRCQSCRGFFTDARKQELLNAGRWEPTAVPSQPGFYSYHISSLYAPAGMYDWAHYVNNYVECHPAGQARKEDEYKTFINTCLGITYEAAAEAPSANAIQKNTRTYEVGTIPEKTSMDDGNGRIVLLTAAADMNGLEDDARIDYEVVAWAENGATYSLQHGSIGTFISREGTLKHREDRARWTYEQAASNSVWPELDRILQAVYKTDTGRDMRILMSGLDCGHYATKYAYPYLDRTNSPVVGVKGDKDKPYEYLLQNAAAFKPALERPKLYILQVGMYKDRLSQYMQLRWDRSDESQPANFMNFPEPSGGLYTYPGYFAHFEAEHRVIDRKAVGVAKARWVKKNSAVQNHLFDCRIYNLATRDILVKMVGNELKRKDFTWKDYVEIVTGGN